MRSSTTSWLQEHISDMSESLCRYVPGLSKFLLPRANPFILIGCADTFLILVSTFLIHAGSSHAFDTYASISIALITIGEFLITTTQQPKISILIHMLFQNKGTMSPFAVYTGKILLQTTPSHLITQLDKSLREASTLDGVLEFRDEHFWTLSFGTLVGSLHVRVRRDADEQLVLAHVWNKLAGLVQHLTVHIFKDDWMRRTTHQLVYSNQHLTTATNSQSQIGQQMMSSFNLPPPPPPPTSITNFNTSHLSNKSTGNLLVGDQRKLLTSSTIDNDFVFVNP